jgi:hypothetical protein
MVLIIIFIFRVFSKMNNSNASSPRNNGTVVNGYDPFYRTQLTIIAQVTSLAVLGVIIVFGNLASIITFIKTQSLRRRSHYLIICLSVADLLVGVVDFMTMYLFLTGPQWNTFIVVLEVIDTLTGIASVLTLSNISMERFYAIFFPFQHRMVRFRVYVALCAFPWIAATYVSVLYLVSNYYDKSILVVYTYHTFIVATVALVIISISYITIGVKIRQYNPSAQNQNRPSRDQKLAVTLLIVTLASLLTWLPLQCFLVMLYFCESCPFPHFNVLFAMKFLQFCNSGINVFIYIVRMPEFRTAFLALFCGKSGENLRVQESTRMTTASIRNNGFVGDENQTAQNCRNGSSVYQKNSNNLPPYNNAMSSQKMPSGNFKQPYQTNNSNIHNGDARANGHLINQTAENSRSSHNGTERQPTQDNKECESRNTKRQVTQATDVTRKADTSVDKIDINLGEPNDKSASELGLGVMNYACATEASDTKDTRF